jgi:hypothetical protein
VDKDPRHGQIPQLEAHRFALGCVVHRRIRDWRQKGLLPPLRRRGCGRGRGTREVWEQPWIPDQAAAVYRALAKRRTASGAFLVLASLGFPIPVLKFRDALRDWLDALNPRLGNREEARMTPAEYADLLRCVARLDILPHLPTGTDDPPASFHQLTLQIFHNPSYEPSRHELLGWGAEEYVSAEVGWYRAHGSAPILHRAIITASDADLSAVLSDWHEFMLVVNRCFGTGWDSDEDMLYVGPVQLPMLVLMPWLFLVDIHMRVVGVGANFLPGFVGGGILELLEPLPES